MPNNLRFAVFVVSLFIFVCVFLLLKKGRIPLKFSLIWFLSAIIIFLVSVFPGLLTILMNYLGFQTIANMVTGILILILFFITILLTIIVSGQNTKIQLLIQEVSLLKHDMDHKNKEQ